ncbi:MAG: HNH nuclease family protein [Proteobacteria bacterium]|nr:HNH nuclease family protein [Pseudomonadota bacterium]
MRNRGYRVHRRGRPRKTSSRGARDDLISKLKRIHPAAEDYREQSLRIHGLICAKCAREFGDKDRHLLTVHHKDGNPKNNPPDGSNWENLCIYCHDDEHSRSLLGDYLSDEK